MPTVRAAGFRLPFQRKLWLAFATVLLPVSLLLCADLVADARATQRTLLEDQEHTARAVAVQVTESFDAALDLGWAVANDPLVRELDPSRLDAHLQQLALHSSRFNAIGVYDATGVNRGWGDPNTPAEPRLHIGDRPYFQRVMSTNAPVISEVLELRRPTRPALLVSVPVRATTGQPIGVLTLILEARLLERRYLASRQDSNQDIFLVDPQGRLAFDTGHPDLPFDQEAVYSHLPPIKTALAGLPTQVEHFVEPLTGGERLGAIVPVTRYHWVVGVTVSRAATLAPLDQRWHMKIAAFSGILVLSGYMATVLSRRQARPVRQLQGLAQALGRGETPAPVHLGTGDEMEELGEAFNQMAARIAQRQHEVEELRTRTAQHASQLDAIIASVPDAIFLAHPEGRLCDANPAGRRRLGVAPDELLDVPLSDYLQRYQLCYLDGRPLTLAELPLQRALAGETFSDVELSMRQGNGLERLVSVNGAPVRDASGRIILGEVVVRDISERKRTESERLQMLERERALGRIAQALVQEVELERLTQVASEQCLHALGLDAVGLWLARPEAQRLQLVASHGMPRESMDRYRELTYSMPLHTSLAAREEKLQVVEDLLQTTLFSLSHEFAMQEGIRSMVAQPLHSHERLVGVMTCFFRTPRHFSPRELEFHSTVGQLLAVALEKARLFQEVREALRLREEFMSAAAHELRTPVTTIQTWADLLARTEVGSARQQKGLAAIGRNTRRLARLVEHLFTAVWMAPGLPKLERNRVDLRALVKERISSLSRTTENPIHLEVDEVPIIAADRQRVSEVMAHLLENAIRYSPPRGPIEVRLGLKGREAVVSVRDHGPGIPPERQPHVFEPLYEPLPPGTAGYVSVVGLGLHLSWRIIEAHGGRIWLESTPEGTTFRFSLPLDPEPGVSLAQA